MMEKILTKNIETENSHRIGVYMESGGYEAWKKVLKEMSPEEVTDIVKESGLRGRGGAGFPAGLKWSFVPKVDKPKYLVCNADESEPGTFKDRLLLEKDPHMMLEGIVIASYAIKANTAFVYIRGEFANQTVLLHEAIQEMKDKGLLGKNILSSGYDLEILVTRGAGAYICGEETALLTSLEGKRGYPKIKPPFPAVEGYLRSPTIVNNVETLCCVPHIISKGTDWFKSIGTEKSSGPKLYCVSGHVRNPGVFELPMGVPLKELIFDHAGGILHNRKLKAVIPGGSSTPVLTESEIDINMDFDSVAAAGSMLGSAGIIVMDEYTDMVDACYNLSKFYAHETCGQCTPCREGVPWMKTILGRITNGKGRRRDIDLLLDICKSIEKRTICPFGDAAVAPVKSYIEKFREEFDYYIEYKKSMIQENVKSLNAVN
ncbi:NADH-quinone oxidoreductase subunit NuoF [Candidatus Marinimicrobia bacterium MT.SAG.2]|nr:NADH-quinone oxidoreductase subunit NuoF [Candidatus Marinimicrobia bacterium MT.SAG.2]